MSKSIKLSEALRNTIRERVITSVFDKRNKELAKAQQALGDKVYNDLYPTNMQQLMNAMPEGFLPTAGGVRVQFGESRFGYTQVVFPERRRVADRHDSGTAARYPDDHPLAVEFNRLSAVSNELDTERCNLHQKLKGLLASVNTVRKLNELWPEGAEFTTDLTPVAAPVPMVIPTEINEIIAAAKK